MKDKPKSSQVLSYAQNFYRKKLICMFECTPRDYDNPALEEPAQKRFFLRKMVTVKYEQL